MNTRAVSVFILSLVLIGLLLMATPRPAPAINTVVNETPTPERIKEELLAPPQAEEPPAADPILTIEPTPEPTGALPSPSDDGAGLDFVKYIVVIPEFPAGGAVVGMVITGLLVLIGLCKNT